MTLDYLAGLIDGEGCFDLSKQGRRYSPGYRRTSLQITMTCPEVLYAVRDQFGGRIQGPYHRIGNDGSKRKASYCWLLTKRTELEPLIDALLPRLLVKRADAERVLAYMRAYPFHAKRPRADAQRWDRANWVA